MFREDVDVLPSFCFDSKNLKKTFVDVLIAVLASECASNVRARGRNDDSYC